MFVRQVHEFLGDLLFEVEFRVELLQRVDALSGKPSIASCRAFLPAVDRCSVLLRRCASLSFSHLLAKPRQHLHVALAALDFLVENHAVETFAAFGQLLRQIEMRVRDETKAIDMTSATIDLGFLDPLGNLHFLLAGQQRHLAHLLEIHPHRIVEDVELRFRLFFLFFFGVFLAVLVTIDLGRFDDVDLQSAQARQDGVELVRVGSLRPAALRSGRRK